MSLPYIRQTYGVPAERGAPVRYAGRRGIITSAFHARLRVRLDGDHKPIQIHPTDDDLEYIEEPPLTRIEIGQHYRNRRTGAIAIPKCWSGRSYLFARMNGNLCRIHLNQFAKRYELVPSNACGQVRSEAASPAPRS